MGFLRRQEAQPSAVENAAPAPALMRSETIHEECWFCGRGIVIESKQPTTGIVALLIDGPGGPQHAVSHRGCAERAKT
jgi:hypothetical protein